MMNTLSGKETEVRVALNCTCSNRKMNVHGARNGNGIYVLEDLFLFSTDFDGDLPGS